MHKEIKSELSDCMWYIAQGCIALNTSIEELIDINTAVVSARYPDGFEKINRIIEKKAIYNGNIYKRINFKDEDMHLCDDLIQYHNNSMEYKFEGRSCRCK